MKQNYEFNKATIVAASTSGVAKIATYQLQYPRYIHGEVMTHRDFSRNAMSSRAVPVRKILAQVWSSPVTPIAWGTNKPGMQAGAELTGVRLWLAKVLWKAAAKSACVFAWALNHAGLHKQWANRILEPWQLMHTVVTATEWDNFWELRCHKDAQPEFQDLARKMQAEFVTTPFVHRGLKTAEVQAWHLPYITEEERGEYSISDLKMFSAARCARVSYKLHDGTASTPDKDRELYEKLVVSKPAHASPVEHQARPAVSAFVRSGNFVGWTQHRKELGL